jgi:NAD(P)H-hydrate epimerase
MSLPLPQARVGVLGREAGERLFELAQQFDLAAVGPGLGRAEETVTMVRRLMAAMEMPVVLDADGLNAVAGHLECIEERDEPTVMTPHPGEMMRLCGAESVDEVQKRARRTAARLADRSGAIVVLKGHGTIVTDGSRCYINHTGNPGMASGGSGDVLTGLISGLMCQGLSPFGAAGLGVFLHGLAGDLAAAERTELAMIPEDIMTFVPAAAGRIPLSDEGPGDEWFDPAEVLADVE